MNLIGKELEKLNYEFLAINSKVYKHPQFVCIDPQKQKTFVLVKAVTYPNNPDKYDEIWMQSFITHAQKFNAKVLYAGVGLANAQNPEKPLAKNEDFIVNFNGFKTLRT